MSMYFNVSPEEVLGGGEGCSGWSSELKMPSSRAWDPRDKAAQIASLSPACKSLHRLTAVRS